MSDSEYEKWLNTHTKDSDAYMRSLQESYYKNPFDTKVAGEYLPLAGRFGALKEVNIDGRTFKYDPRTIDREKNRFVAFDPESGEIRHAFIGDIKEEMDALKRKWRIQNGYENEADKYTSYNEEGGVISMQTGGGFNLAQAVNRDLEERNKVRAKQTGNDEKVQKARDRVVSNGDDSFINESDSIGQPDAGFSGAEIARLVSIGADITSMFLDPVTGTAVGLGSTLTNFGADIADDGFQWEDVKNLGINAGFDLLGAIPLFGDALGTGTKITRNLVKWAPRMMGLLAGYQGVANFDGMMNSWGKFTSGDEDQKLTVQDWRNIAQSIGLVTGATRAIKNKAAQSKMKNEARVDGVVGVNVRDKNTGEIKQLLVDGKTAETIKGHKGDAKKIQETLSQLEGYKDKFGENGTWEINTKKGGWQKPIGRHEKANGDKEWGWDGFRKEGRADVNDVYDFSQVPQGYGASAGYKIPGVSDRLNAWHQQAVSKLSGNPTQINAKGAMTSTEVDAKYAELLKNQGIDAQMETLKAASAARKKQQQLSQDQLTQAQADLNAAKQKVAGYGDEATLNTQKSNLETQIAGMPASGAMHDASKQVVSLQKTLTDLQNYRQKLYSERSGHLTTIEGKKKAAIDSNNKSTAELTKQQKELVRAQAKVKKAEKALQKKYPTKPKRTDANYSEYRKDQNALKKLKNAVQSAQQKVNLLNQSIADNTNVITTADANLTKVRSAYDKKFSKNAQSINDTKGKIGTAKPLSDQYSKYTKAKQDLDLVNSQLNDYAQITPVQQKVNNLEAITRQQASVHTKAYTDLQNMLNNLRTTHSQIGGRQLSWDMDELLNNYGVTDAFKQGGSIDKNKINKFLKYAKG